MTPGEVKRDLPDVPVTVGKARHMAKVGGRLNAFATVTVSFVRNGKGYLRGAPWLDAHFSWEAVARAITTGEPLDMNS